MIYRFHVNNKITDEGGGDLSRTFDIEALSREEAVALLAESDNPLAEHEEIEQINEVHLTPPVPDPIEMNPLPIPPPRLVLP